MGGRLLAAALGATALVALAAGCGSEGDGDGLGTTAGRGTIVSIGDSVASGEGNPARDGPAWEDRRCHRSAAAGQTLAARKAQRSHPDLGYASFACSGATINRGLLGPYRGIAPTPFQRKAPPQLDELKRVEGRGEVAAAMLSIGANDLGFTKIVAFCAVVTRCWQQHFNRGFPLAEAGPKRPLLDDYVSARLDQLDDDYGRLDAALRPLVPAERVVIVEYFDPTTAANGTDCRVLGGISPVESSWAREHVVFPLNAEIEAAAEEHGWRVVSGVAEHFRGHGACAEQQRWVRQFGEGPPTGTLHPNEQGHREIAGLITPVLREALGG
jgi:lysophospholipase L1-like esterase